MVWSILLAFVCVCPWWYWAVGRWERKGVPWLQVAKFDGLARAVIVQIGRVIPVCQIIVGIYFMMHGPPVRQNVVVTAKAKMQCS